ncbi:response regulator transcription factor [Nitrospirillum sp. BR 11828]|uniref:response regulator transcription factor n=1 Tax=Nitrospirillum sp. BR 11828 TaxID=3104325 RepID=UPI002ACA7632|nr:response regulator transcription factor [Nitrospirillum sp. BR 11828]MDZ5648499.1 response regulator transcription factor [Nitrospirillum sp. BR 11828]
MNSLSIARILLVEDDPAMRTLILRVLKENGFEATGVRDGRDMADALGQGSYDLVLLDVMLPGQSGLDICRELRRTSQVPIIMVSAHGEEIDMVLGLEMGADDYVPKPFRAKELLARIRALLRRAGHNGAGGGNGAGSIGSAPQDVMVFAGWRLDRRRRELTDPDGVAVDLSGAEHDLLVSFLENRQRVIGRERLLELSRARLGEVNDRSIDVLVSRLRRKLGDENRLIRTVRGVGYIFTADVILL